MIPHWTELPDPFAPERLNDPYPYYRLLREAARVHVSRSGSHAFARYADCSAILRDNRWGRDGTEPDATKRVSFARLNPPDHTRLRGLVSKAFTPRHVTELGPRIENTVHQLLDQAEKRGGMEVVEEFAYLLPAAVIRGMLGVPDEDAPVFNEWCADVHRGLDSGWVTGVEVARRAVENRRAALINLRHYMRDLLRRRRMSPGEDLISRLIEACDDDDRLTNEEIVVTCRMLLVAGFETTVNLISDGTLALLRNPDQRAMVTDGTLSGDDWVDELMRYDGPTQIIVVSAREPIEYLGHEYEAGDAVELMIGSANHDPAVFADPESLDLKRPHLKQLGFGLGIHYCLGAALARLEVRIALSALFQRAPGLRPAGDIVRRPRVHMRGLDRLPVRWA